MKTRIFSLLVFLLVLSLTIAFAQKKSECPYMAGNKSCCETGNKASMTKAASTQPTVMLASNKKADTKTTQATTKKSECTEADKAQCDMHKASTASKSAKMDCCKDKSAKTAKAEKKAPEKTEAKGTN